MIQYRSAQVRANNINRSVDNSTTYRALVARSQFQFEAGFSACLGGVLYAS